MAPKLTEVFRLNERLESVSGDRRFLWVDSAHEGPASLKPGSTVRPFHGYWHPPGKKTEQVLESVRVERFPDRPARNGSVYVFPGTNYTHAVRYARRWSTDDEYRYVFGGHNDVYLVEVTGKVFYGHMTIVTEMFGSWGNDERLTELAVKYWTGVSRPDQGSVEVECVVDGSVSIVKKLDGSKVTGHDEKDPEP